MSKDEKKARFAWLIVLIVFLSFVIPSLANAQIGENGGVTELKSDISMMSGIPVHGGGHFTWKVSGQAAQDFRNVIIENYDLPLGGGDGTLSYEEVNNYALELERYLEQNELQYQGANTRAFAPLNKDIKKDTSGLIGTKIDDTDEIEIRFYFDAWLDTGSQDISLSDTIINDAIYAPLNQSFEGTYKIEHTEYMVNIADYSNVKINKGSFFLIRTPFGEIYHYSVSFKAGEETGDELTYEDFNWIECPLILFIVVAVFGYFTVTMPDRFRRHDVLKIGFLHTISKILLLILLVLYFFAGFGGFFVSGVYLWILCIVFLFVTLLLSKTMYENAKRITAKPKEEPAAAEKEPIVVEDGEPKAEVGKKDVQCLNCGDIYQLAEFDTLSSALCPACGKMGATELPGEEEPEAPMDEPPPEEPMEPPEVPPEPPTEEPPPKAPEEPPPEAPPEEPPESPPSEPKEAPPPKKAPPPPKKRPPRPPKKSKPIESEES